MLDGEGVLDPAIVGILVDVILLIFPLFFLLFLLFLFQGGGTDQPDVTKAICPDWGVEDRLHGTFQNGEGQCKLLRLVAHVDRLDPVVAVDSPVGVH